MTTPSDYPASNVDTEGVYGNAGAAPLGTQFQAGDTETSTFAAGGGGANTDSTVNALTATPETDGLNGQPLSAYVATPPPLLGGDIDTGMVNWPETPGVVQAYRAPNTTVGYLTGSGEKDTTWTDSPVSSGSATPPVGSAQTISGTLDSYTVGSGIGPTTTNMPVQMSAPTVAAGPRQVTVTWVDQADPAGAPIRDYVIMGSTGGTTFAPKNATSVVVTDLVPDQSYTFQVAARNDNGLGQFSPASSAAAPYNPDEADHANPGGIAPANQVNPVYYPDGTIKAGTGGKPLPPTGLTLTTSATGSVVATWTDSTGIAPAGGYTVFLSNGSSHNVANNLATYTFTGQSSVGSVLTGYVSAIGTATGGNTNSTTATLTGDVTAQAAPTLAGSGATNLTATWTASTPVAAPNGYTVTLSTGQTATVAAGVLSHQFTGLTTGTATTATVKALGYVDQITSAASASVNVP